jgi:DNA-binding PadR family transcriptional regulator
MNISKFVVLGALEALETAGGYDIIRFLEQKKINRWTDIKNGSIYNALKTLSKCGDIQEVGRVKKGLFPTMTHYTITDQGRKSFDTMQEQAFLGIYPLFLGFKLALKFNKRRTHAEIRRFVAAAVDVIEKTMQEMDDYLNSLPVSGRQRKSDAFFIEHDRMLLLAEKQWIQMILEKLNTNQAEPIDGL